MALYTELSLLREEERVLMKIASRLNDQLNRLKVEELALLSLIRNSRTDARQTNELATTSETTSHIAVKKDTDSYAESLINTMPLLNLEVKHSTVCEEEEEDEEDDAYEQSMNQDQLTAFLEQMEQQHRAI